MNWENFSAMSIKNIYLRRTFLVFLAIFLALYLPFLLFVKWLSLPFKMLAMAFELLGDFMIAYLELKDVFMGAWNAKNSTE